MKNKPTPARKRVKARSMFTVTSKDGVELYPSRSRAEFGQQLMEDLTGDAQMVEPVFVLPADAQSIEEMVKEVAKAIHMDDAGPVAHRAARFEAAWAEQGIEAYYLERKAKRVLSSLNLIAPPKKKGGK